MTATCMTGMRVQNIGHCTHVEHRIDNARALVWLGRGNLPRASPPEARLRHQVIARQDACDPGAPRRRPNVVREAFSGQITCRLEVLLGRGSGSDPSRCWAILLRSTASMTQGFRAIYREYIVAEAALGHEREAAMTKMTILCWQEIPSVVEARGDAGTHKVELSLRFQELIDLIAMKRASGRPQDLADIEALEKLR